MVVQELRKMAEDICVERWCIFISDDWKYVEAISSRVTSFAKNTGSGLYSYIIESSEETVAESSTRFVREPVLRTDSELL